MSLPTGLTESPRRGARALVKTALMRSRLSPLTTLEYVSFILRFGQWMRAQQADRKPRFVQRVDLYKHVNDIVAGPVDYLEFGVASGVSFRKWVGMNTHPASRFFGFDTFEGLPEDLVLFDMTIPKGTFSRQGQTPAIDDRRANFTKGLFYDTLRPFLQSYRPANRLVIHMDADLYNATMYVLSSLNDVMCGGTILIFDEFSSVTHELRAFLDYVSCFRRSYRLLATSGRFACPDQAAILLE